MGADLHPIAFRFTQDFSEAMFDWLFPFAVIFVAVFFTPALESIKLRLNRVDLSTRQFEEFAIDLSNFVFRAQRFHDFYHKGWTAPDLINPVIEDYYQAITRTSNIGKKASARSFCAPRALSGRSTGKFTASVKAARHPPISRASKSRSTNSSDPARSFSPVRNGQPPCNMNIAISMVTPGRAGSA